MTGENFPQSVKVSLRTGKETGGDTGVQVDAVVADDRKSLSFKVPKDPFKTGRYLVYVSYDTPAVAASSNSLAVPAVTKDLAVPGELTVAPDDMPAVGVDSISPATAYRSKDGAFDFVISGNNMAPVATDNSIEEVGGGLLAVGTQAECQSDATIKQFEADGKKKQLESDDTNKLSKKVCLSYPAGLDGHELLVKGYQPPPYKGSVLFRVHVGSGVSAAKAVVFSSVSEGELRGLAIVVSLVIAAIVLLMVWKGIGLYKIAGESYTPLQCFFLDKETNSYSLSKFQLVAWTSVAVFGYIYLTLCQSLIQWTLTFPDVPSGWPTLLGVSAATTVTAVGITTNRGSKGSGPVLPSLADFITSGGMVMSSRFQFFVWTLVGCAGFLYLTLINDPSGLKALPDVPTGFLYLMGISSAGYLGGKLVALPGPVVQQLVVKSVNPASPALLVINLKGQNLSTNAAVKVDDTVLRMKEQFTIELVTAQVQPPDPSFCTEVAVKLTAADSYLDGVHTLTITNQDGQMAASKFPLDALTITTVNNLPPTTGPVVQVNGTNFVDGMTAEWKNATAPAGTPPVAASSVQKKSGTQVEVTLVPGTAGKGTLTLVSPIFLRAHVDVTVNAPGAA